jgi:hypothetical protein
MPIAEVPSSVLFSRHLPRGVVMTTALRDQDMHSSDLGGLR